MIKTKAFFDQRTSTVSYVLASPAGEAAVVDPIVDCDPQTGKTWNDSVGRIADYLSLKGYELRFILETHPHANHLSGAKQLKASFPLAEVVISERIREMQSLWRTELDLPPEVLSGGAPFHRLVEHGEELLLGNETIRALHTPGHSPADLCFRTQEAVFTGATLFQPDVGCGRTDLPGGDAGQLFESIQTEIYSLPKSLLVFAGHDYPLGGRGPAWQSTVGEQRASNVELRAGEDRESFVRSKEAANQNLQRPQVLFGRIRVSPEVTQQTPDAAFSLPVGAFPRAYSGPMKLKKLS